MNQDENIEPKSGRFRLRGSAMAAAAIAIIVALWLGSGMIQRAGDLLSSEPDKLIAEQKTLPSVRTQVIIAENKRPEIIIRGGKIEAERSVTVRAEISGKVVAISGEEGQPIRKGDMLCAIALNARMAEKEQAQAVLNLRTLQLQAAKKLAQQGHNTRISLAQSQANFNTAQAMLEKSKLAVENTKILSPFDGILEKLFVDEGDVMNPGTPCAKIIDMSPLVLSGQVTEEEVSKIRLNSETWALLPDGSRLDGHIRYISSSAETKTRTFRIEMEAHDQPSIARDGLSVQIHALLPEVRAHRIDSSTLILNDKGQLGMRIIEIKDGKGIVRFHPIKIVSSDADDFWVAGLPEITRVITVGQEYVNHGTQVAINEDPPSGSIVSPDGRQDMQNEMKEERGL